MASSTSHQAEHLRSLSPCRPGSPQSSLARNGFDPPYLQSIIRSSNVKAQKTTYLECGLMNNRGRSSHVKSLNAKNQTLKNIHEKCLEMKKSSYIIFVSMLTAGTSCENLKFLLLVDMSQSLEKPRPRLTMLKFLSQQVKAKSFERDNFGMLSLYSLKDGHRLIEY